MTKNICLECKHLTHVEPNGIYAVCDRRKWLGKQPVSLLVSICEGDCDDFVGSFYEL